MEMVAKIADQLNMIKIAIFRCSLAIEHYLQMELEMIWIENRKPFIRS